MKACYKQFVKFDRIIILIVFCGFIVVGNSANAIEPLSCRMQIMLHMVTAERRDQGVTMEGAVKVLRTGDELTSSEIKYIIDNVYNRYKKKTANEIGNIIMNKCN